MSETVRKIDTSPHVFDEIRQTTCYMCACRCGINVHMRKGADGQPKVRYIEGSRNHPINKAAIKANRLPAGGRSNRVHPNSQLMAAFVLLIWPCPSSGFLAPVAV